MRVPLSWLSEYVDITPPCRGARPQTDDRRRRGRRDHPHRRRLGRHSRRRGHRASSRTRTRTACARDGRSGGRASAARVVCGAPNVAAGQKVAFAREGTKLIDGHTGEPTVLKAAKIRGVESAGMVLSEKELGISDSTRRHRRAPPRRAGRRAALVRPRRNRLRPRPHAKPPGPALRPRRRARSRRADRRQACASRRSNTRRTASRSRAALESKSQDPDLCPRYVAALIEGVKIGQSPPGCRSA